MLYTGSGAISPENRNHVFRQLREIALLCSSISVSLLTREGFKDIDKQALDGAIASFFYNNFEDKRVIDTLAESQKYFEPISNGKFLQYGISWVKMGNDYAYVAHIKASDLIASVRRRVQFFFEIQFPIQ